MEKVASPPSAAEEAAARPEAVRSYAALLSTMRSGSTLVKALLGSAPDIAHLPETNFRAVLRSPARQAALERAHPKGILLLKRPAWFNEAWTYPRVPRERPVRCVVLLRDAFPTVRSVARMLGGKRGEQWSGLAGLRLLTRLYWAPVTRRLLAFAEAGEHAVAVVRYEDILERPEEETLRLFHFLGSAQAEGVRRYGEPENARWKWGRDDGSPRIRTREVQPPRPLGEADLRRKAALDRLPGITELRRRAGFA